MPTFMFTTDTPHQLLGPVHVKIIIADSLDNAIRQFIKADSYPLMYIANLIMTAEWHLSKANALTDLVMDLSESYDKVGPSHPYSRFISDNLEMLVEFVKTAPNIMPDDFSITEQ